MTKAKLARLIELSVDESYEGTRYEVTAAEKVELAALRAEFAAWKPERDKGDWYEQLKAAVARDRLEGSR